MPVKKKNKTKVKKKIAKKTKVKKLSSNELIILPTEKSISVITSAYKPFPVLFSKFLETNKGT